MKLSILKPLHAKWLIDLYNYMTLPDGQAVLLKGWKVAGITEAVQKGFNGFPSLGPFHDIDPLSFTPNAEDNTFQNEDAEEDEEQWLKAKKRTLMRKSGLKHTEMLLIYLKLTRTESISLRL